MPWLKILHITTLAVWCGALLYLPALIAASVRQDPEADAAGATALSRPGLTRQFFTLVATPAALLAIVSGSLLFIEIVDMTSMPSFPAWLLIKLLMVAGMVICHAFCGWLIQRSESLPVGATGRGLTTLCALTAALSTLLVLAVLYLVLAKPL